MTVYYLTGDLMFSSRASMAAQGAGCTLRVIGSADKLCDELAAKQNAPNDTDPCKLLLVDLTLAGLNIAALMERVRQLSAPPQVVAYGPHVHEQALSAAQAAGCDQVLTRGQFDRQMPELLAMYSL